MENIIRNAIIDIIQELDIDNIDFIVEHPSDIAYGDYSSNIAMVLAKKIRKSPRKLAQEIVQSLSLKNIENVQRCEVAGAGFINFYLTRDFFNKNISLINNLGDDWGRNELLKNKKVLIEYTDPNPFKEFHIGHLFTNSVGESLSRLIEFSGADIKRLCYQGDVGMHVAKSIWGLQNIISLRDDKDDFEITPKILGQAYAIGSTEYSTNKTSEEEIKVLNKKIYERTDVDVNHLYDTGRKISLEYFDHVYSIVGTKFDEYFFESQASAKGKELVLNHPEVFVKSNGAIIFDGTSYGLHTRVFINSEGLPTYEAKDLALAKMKEDRLGEYDLSIISTSNEITEYFKVLKKAMSSVYPELEQKTEHIGHGTVRLSTGKMSSRTGEVIPAIEFIDYISEEVRKRMYKSTPELSKDTELVRDIAIAAIRYATLKGNILQDTIFDKEQALSFEGASGPYLQYTHARIYSVIHKASIAGVVSSNNVIPSEPYEIEKILYRFNAVVEEAMIARAPHKISTYLLEISGLYNSFYAQEKIVDISDEFSPYKVALSSAVAHTLKNGLWLLGIKAPNKM